METAESQSDEEQNHPKISKNLNETLVAGKQKYLTVHAPVSLQPSYA